MLEELPKERITRERNCGVKQRFEIEIGADAALAHERSALCEPRRLCGVAPDFRDQRELIEGLVERDSRIDRNLALAFQRAGFRRGLLRRFLRFSR